MKRGPEPDEAGMILVNVLMFVAIASAMVLLMINREALALDGAVRMREASRALAIARGGELSVLVALRRDAEEAPDSDHRGEAWANLGERGVAIEGGSFDLAVSDAQGRFNINLVRSGDAAPLILFQTIAQEAGASREQILKLVELVRLTGPVTDIRPLRAAGLDAELAARLERLVTALPGRTSINLNAADQEMLRILFRDPVVAERLAAVRDRQGYLTPEDLAEQNVTMPFGTGFRSETFWVRTRATIGDTSQEIATLVQRRRSDGVAEAMPVERWRGAAVPPGAPPLAQAD
ncbi:general secretion pathway protein GspK [Sphingosinithalassobacter sp. LHW66-3]|uniref:general secretion pathway protein GspK n=1 Tax=Sphingosinithalassobacter sp. LHW66-3 TaxID=3424718 RepID=UPI003D6BCFB0